MKVVDQAKASGRVPFREVVETEAWEGFLGQLPLMIGERDDGRMLVADLASLHHLLVAGEADRDRTTCLNAMICGLLAVKSSKEVQFILTDTCGAGFAAHYQGLPHLIEPVITDSAKIPVVLKRMKAEMEKRLKLFRKAGVRNLKEFNERGEDELVRVGGSAVATLKTLSAIVLVLDDLTDVVAADRKAVGRDLNRLLCLGCPAGIYVIASAKNPSGKLIGYDTACNFHSRRRRSKILRTRSARASRQPLSRAVRCSSRRGSIR